MKKFIKHSLLAITVAAFTTVASAIPTSGNLADLSQGGSIGIGDKVFSGFSFQQANLDNFSAANIQVNASIVGGIYYLTWGGSFDMSFWNTGTSLATKSGDLKLNYTVTANPGSITMIDQQYTGSGLTILGSTAQGIQIDESVFAGGQTVANSHLDINDISDPFAETGDNLNVNPSQHVLQVTKDIAFKILALPGGIGNISVSEVRQSFHQGVPDGGMTVMLLGAALGGLAWANSRRK